MKLLILRFGHRLYWYHGANLSGPTLKKKLTSKSRFNFKIAYQNVRGVRSKLSSLYNSSFDFEFEISNFNIYRRDRRYKNGGGVLISIRFKYTSEWIDLCSENIECISVKVYNRGKSIYITCSYIPPCSGIHIYGAHIVLISKVIDLIGPERTIEVFGDFNLLHTSWIFYLRLDH